VQIFKILQSDIFISIQLWQKNSILFSKPPAAITVPQAMIFGVIFDILIVKHITRDFVLYIVLFHDLANCIKFGESQCRN
jgi:hypothetical protein